MNIEDRNLIKVLKVAIGYEDQKIILDSVKSSGSKAEVEAKVTDPFWIAEGLRKLKDSSTFSVPENEKGRLSYLLRMRSDLEWEWSDSASARTVRKVLKPIEGALRSITRVSTIVQIPGQSVPPHRDLIVGDVYENLTEPTSTFTGKKTLQYQGDPWFSSYAKNNPNNCLHKKQDYFGLRIPISEKLKDNGRPFLQELHGSRFHYSTEDRLFLLNEATTNHGADVIDFYRGVVIVDGELDLSKLKSFYDPDFKVF